MALLTIADAKAYRRVTWATEDALFTSFLAEGLALVERHIGRIVAASVTLYGMADPTESPWRSVQAFYLPQYPIAANPVITDADDVVVDPLTYRVERAIGKIVALDSADWFASGPYTVVVDAGWSAHPDYATQIEPLINAIVRDYVLDRYDNREAGYRAVTAGGGVARTQEGTELPPRALKTLERFRKIRV